MAVENFSTLIVAVLAVTISSAQTMVARRGIHGNVSSQTLATLWSPDSVHFRAAAFELEGKPVASLTPDEIETATAVLRQFSHIGFLTLNGHIAQRALFRFWAPQLVHIYVVLQPFVEDRRNAWSKPEQWLHAEWLARKAAIHLKRRNPTLGTSRAWKRLKAQTGSLSSFGSSQGEAQAHRILHPRIQSFSTSTR